MSIFKETFPKEIADQIQLRQDLLVRRNKTDLSYLNSRKAWVRLTSGVNTLEAPSDKNKTEPTNALAKLYVLQGGTLNNANTDINAPFTGSLRAGIGSDSTYAYSTKTPSGKLHRLGIRPMPGITGVDIKSKSAYGSLREATVTFICWDIAQLEDLELLYMRPGFTSLLEWGWSPYVGNDDKYKTLVQLYDKFLSGPIPTGENTLQEIYKELHQLSMQQSGNYDALIGYVKNFQWSFRADGGYDCSTTIISFGEVLESLKVNYAIPEISNSDKIKGFLKVPGYIPPKDSSAYFPNVYNKSKLAGLFYEMAVYMETSLKTKLWIPTEDNGVSFSKTSFGEKYYDLFALSISVSNPSSMSTTQDINIGTLPSNNNYQYYITLESLCQLLNKYILVTTENGSLAGVSTLDRKYYPPLPSNPNSPAPPPTVTINQPTQFQQPTGSSLLCLTHPLELSVDPSMCLINSPTWIKGFNFPKVNENVATQGGVDKAHNEDAYGDANLSAEASGVVQSVIDFYIDETGTVDDIRKKFYNYFNGKEDKVKALQELVIQYEVKRGGESSNTTTTQELQGRTDAVITTTTTVTSATNIISSKKVFLKTKYPNSGFRNFNDFLADAGVNWFLISGFSNSNQYSAGLISITLDGTYKYTPYKNDYGYDVESANYKLFPLKPNEVKDFISAINFNTTHDYTSIAKSIKDREAYNKASEELSSKSKAALKFLSKLSPFFKDNEGTSGLGYISNIYVNLNYLYTLALNQNLESQDKKEKNEINVYDYLKTIVGDIQSSTGNVNQFDIHVDPIDNIGRIIDINFTSEDPAKDYKNATIIEIQGLKSTARNVNLQSQIFPEQSSIVAISAQNGGGTIGLDNTTLVGFNRGIKDRIMPDKYVPKTGNETPITTETKLVNIGQSIGSLAGYLTNLLGIYDPQAATKTVIYSTANSADYKNALRDIIVAIRTITNDPNQFKAIIPTKLSITMDGIGGIIIGNLFRIPDESLPRGYKSDNTEGSVGRRLGYVVTGISHKIDTGFWETTIDGQTVILEPNDPSNGKIDYASIIVTDPVPAPGEAQSSFLFAGASKGFSQDNIKTAVNFFMNTVGFSDYQTAAIVGALLQESKLDPSIVNSIGAVGIAQWLGDRKKSLQSKSNPTSLQTQLNFIVEELFTTEKAAGNQISNSNTLEEAIVGMASYERFAGYFKGINYNQLLGTKEIGNRVSYTNDILTRIRNGEFSSFITPNQPGPLSPTKPQSINIFNPFI